ncbi:MAG: hypothetical protein HYY04_11210 [Chloroflexi bacterium]|nr:hypothetical protein [Chloroflexota bacterium]
MSEGTAGSAAISAVASSKAIQPGESAYVLVTIDQPLAGVHDQRLHILSNDAVEPEQAHPVRFEVVE